MKTSESRPTVSSPGLCLGLAACFLVLIIPAASGQEGEAKLPIQGLPSDMEPYTETIPGTDITFEMIPVPGGTFMMGSDEDEEGFTEDDGPRHKVVVGPFWMGKCEVTWEEYDQFAFSYDLKNNPVDPGQRVEGAEEADAISRPTPPYADETFGFGRNGKPAICITHHAVMEYCRWLSLKTGKLYRIPTEAEWEYAARGGSDSIYFFGDDVDQLEEFAWFFDNAGEPMPVGQLKPNPFGLHDILGNVAEWCLDYYEPLIYAERAKQEGPAIQPVVKPKFNEYPYVVRGGSFDDFPEMLRVGERRASFREWSLQDPQRPQSVWWHTDATVVGFRVMRPYQEQENLQGLKSLVIKGKDPSSGAEVYYDDLGF